MRLLWGFQKLVKRLPWGKNLSIDTKNTYGGDLVEKIEDLKFFGLKYGNLC